MKLYDMLPETVRVCGIKPNNFDFSKDELIVAALLHDSGKIFEYMENSDKTFRWRTDAEMYFNSSVLDEIWASVEKIPRFDKIANAVVTRPTHEFLSVAVAKYIFNESDTPWNKNINNAIMAHMGGWSKTNISPKPIAQMLHCADLLGSQF